MARLVVTVSYPTHPYNIIRSLENSVDSHEISVLGCDNEEICSRIRMIRLRDAKTSFEIYQKAVEMKGGRVFVEWIF